MVPLNSMVNLSWPCPRLFGLEFSSVLYRTVAIPLLPLIHVYLLMVLRAESSSSSYLDSAAVYMHSLYSGLELLHQGEGLITAAECGRIGRYGYIYGQCKAVVQIILAKSVSESFKICGICEQYQLFDRYNMNLIKGLSVCDLV